MNNVSFYIDTMGGLCRCPFSEATTLDYELDCRSVGCWERKKCYPNQHKYRYMIHGPSRRVYGLQFDLCETGDATINVLHLTCDIQCESEAVALAHLEWLGMHQTQSHTRKEVSSNYKETVYLSHRREDERQRGTEFAAYVPEDRRNIVHFEFRLWGTQMIRRVLAKSGVSMAQLTDPEAIKAVIRQCIRLRRTDHAELIRQVNKRHRLDLKRRTFHYGYVPRLVGNILSRSRIGTRLWTNQRAQFYLDRYRRRRGVHAEKWSLPVPLPQWLSDALAPAPITIGTIDPFFINQSTSNTPTPLTTNTDDTRRTDTGTRKARIRFSGGNQSDGTSINRTT